MSLLDNISVPTFSRPVISAGSAMARRRDGVAYARLYTPWWPQVEWFVLELEPVRGLMLALRRVRLAKELGIYSLAEIEALRGPRYERVLLDEAFDQLSIEELL